MTTQRRSPRPRTALTVLVCLAVLAGTDTGAAQEPTTTRIQQAEKEPQAFLLS